LAGAFIFTLRAVCFSLLLSCELRIVIPFVFEYLE
jgi:hypothetical protein